MKPALPNLERLKTAALSLRGKLPARSVILRASLPLAILCALFLLWKRSRSNSTRATTPQPAKNSTANTADKPAPDLPFQAKFINEEEAGKIPASQLFLPSMLGPLHELTPDEISASLFELKTRVGALEQCNETQRAMKSRRGGSRRNVN